MQLYGELPKSDVTFSLVAREMEVTSQSLYRYFRDKNELFEAAANFDFQNIVHEVLTEIADDQWAVLSGRCWTGLGEVAICHPMVVRLVTERDPYMLSLVSGRFAEDIRDRVADEITRAQKKGLVRKDIDATVMTQALHTFASSALIPMVFEGRYNSPEWLKISSVVTAALFYPYPDLSTQQSIQAFADKFRN